MIEKKDGKYILEGIFTEFDTMNRNPSRPYLHRNLPFLVAMNRMNKIKRIFNVWN